MNWLFYALVTILLYGAHDVLLKHLSDQTNALVASLVINISAAVGIAVALAFSYWQNQLTGARPGNREMWMLLIAGVCLGLATVTFMKAFGNGGAFSVVVPLVYVGIILASLLVGKLFFHEKITPVQIAGIVLSCIGLVLVVKK